MLPQVNMSPQHYIFYLVFFCLLSLLVLFISPQVYLSALYLLACIFRLLSLLVLFILYCYIFACAFDLTLGLSEPPALYLLASDRRWPPAIQNMLNLQLIICDDSSPADTNTNTAASALALQMPSLQVPSLQAPA